MTSPSEIALPASAAAPVVPLQPTPPDGPPWPDDAQQQRAVAQQVLDLIFRHRRLNDGGQCRAGCQDCYVPHLDKTLAFIRRCLPIHFVLPAFPAKAPNPRKVLGHLPDTAERVALSFLHDLCVQIAQVYRPGARITICSDGRVFSDLVDVPDDHVTAYREGIRAMLSALGTSHIDTYNLEDEFGPISFDKMRAELCHCYARPSAEIRQNVAEGGPLLGPFNGQARFLFEDMMGRNPTVSRSQARKVTKERAYNLIARSDAWSAVVAKRFPDALRLSIHPQDRHAWKIGIHMVPTNDNWLTPWHGSAVCIDGAFHLVKRCDAERVGARLVYEGGRPVHFVAETTECLKTAGGAA